MALNSSALPDGSLKNIVNCSPGAPVCKSTHCFVSCQSSLIAQEIIRIDIDHALQNESVGQMSSDKCGHHLSLIALDCCSHAKVQEDRCRIENPNA